MKTYKDVWFYDENLLPKGFSYPERYIQSIVKRENVSPWWYVSENPEYAELCFNVINAKLDLGRVLIPFAKCDDGGDVACFDGTDLSGDPKVYFYTGEKTLVSVDWGKRYSLANFVEWLSEEVKS